MLEFLRPSTDFCIYFYLCFQCKIWLKFQPVKTDLDCLPETSACALRAGFSSWRVERSQAFLAHRLVSLTSLFNPNVPLCEFSHLLISFRRWKVPQSKSPKNCNEKGANPPISCLRGFYDTDNWVLSKKINRGANKKILAHNWDYYLIMIY